MARKIPERRPRRNNLQRRCDRSYGIPEQYLMLQDMLDSLEHDQLPDIEVRDFFVAALTEVIQKFPKANDTNARGAVFVEAFGLTRTRGRKAILTRRELDIAVDRHAGMTEEACAEKWEISVKTVSRTYSKVRSSEEYEYALKIAHKVRVRRDAERALYDQCVQKLKAHAGLTTRADGYKLIVPPAGELPVNNYSDREIHKASVELIQACIFTRSGPFPEDVISVAGKPIQDRYRLEMLRLIKDNIY